MVVLYAKKIKNYKPRLEYKKGVNKIYNSLTLISIYAKLLRR